MDQRPDPSFRQYFNWPTNKDPKGTVKTRSVLEEVPISVKSSRSVVCLDKKRKKEVLHTPWKQRVSDEDFLLLKSFISKYFGQTEQDVIIKRKTRFYKGI